MLLALAQPTDAASPDRAPTRRAAAAAAPAPTARELPAEGRFFWANAWAAHETSGDRPGLSGPRRMRLMLDVIRRRHASLGALAEVETPQVAAFRRFGGDYAIVRGGHRGETNAVFYDARRYRPERVTRFWSYFYEGRRVAVPVVVLRDRGTGARIVVMAVRNPANTPHHPHQSRWRRAAVRREAQEVRRLQARYDGRVSVLVGGDFNQREPCRLAARTGLVSAIATVSGCSRVRTRIDQAFADTSVRFTSYAAVVGRRVSRITDHHAVYVAGFTLRQPA